MAKCPICNRNETVEKYKPFCSRHCADVDLNRWFNGGYAIPGPEEEIDEKDRGIE